MIDLKKYLNEKVTVIDNKGKTYVGYAFDYIYADENESGMDVLVVDTGIGHMTGFTQNIVKEIKKS